MKVAVCISGEFRTYKQNYKALKENVLDYYNADVFISTWNTSSAEDKSGNRITIDITREELELMYVPKELNLYKFENSFFYEYEGVKIPQALVDAKPNHFRANIPQFFLMRDCNKLKSAYEKKNGFKYDFVIRNRADLLIFKKIKLEKLEKTKVYLKHIINDTYYCDQFAIGTSDLMNRYTDVFSNLNEYWKDPLQDGQFKNILNGETLMRYHILKNNIPHDRLKVRFPIIRFGDDKMTIFEKVYINNFKNRINLFLIKLGLKK